MTSSAADSNAVTVVHCWSAPRSRSTALLYSFEARGRVGDGDGDGDGDGGPATPTEAIDEPLYRRWLEEKVTGGSGVTRPYTEALISRGGDGTVPPGDDLFGAPEAWMREGAALAIRVREAAERGGPGSVVFCKHMAKHSGLYDFARDREAGSGGDESAGAGGVRLVHKHVLLIRDPVAVLGSWDDAGSVHGSNPTPEEVGILPLLDIYSRLSGRRVVAVVDSDSLAADPAAALRSLCSDLAIPYTDRMLTWHAGPHRCDGPWAPWWYGRVRRSTGWSTSPGGGAGSGGAYRTLGPALVEALRASLPAYDCLLRLAPSHRARGPRPAEMYEDPRNEHLLVWVGAPATKGGGRVLPREAAGLSPWDSSVQGGDACWEGLRVYRGRILSLEKHLRRLFRSARALGFQNVHTPAEVREAIFRTLAANGMRDGAHIRLTLTRGEKCTSSMNPAFNVYGTTLIVLAEWKPTEGATTYDNTDGIVLVSASQRRNPPSCVDSKIHHNNMINNILPKIQANLAGAADALMLDVDGYVSETNATNVFMVDDAGTLLTPHADHCLPGITRETVLRLAEELGIPSEVRRISLAEFHAAHEVFTTGTMGELTPVREIDGRTIGDCYDVNGRGRREGGAAGPVTRRLQEVYRTLPDRPGWATELPEFVMGQTNCY